MKATCKTSLLLLSLAWGSLVNAQTSLGGNEPADTPEITENAPAEPSNQPPPSAPPERPVTTRQAAFSIPFSIDQTIASGSTPVEVQLLVSNDRGKTWFIYLKQRPDVKKFNFRAGGDGEFWFASRTLDAQGRMRPEGQVKPELKVVVDTHAPKFELNATAGPGGEVKTTWSVFDSNLLPESLRIEYRTASSQTWTPLTMTPTGNGASPGSLSGERTFSTQGTSLVVDVRGEVRDDAGNPAVATKRVFLPRVARKPEERPAEGLLSGLAGLARTPFQGADSTTAPPDPFAARRPAPIDANPGAVEAPAGTGSPPATPLAAKPGEATQQWLPDNNPSPRPSPRSTGERESDTPTAGSPGNSVAADARQYPPPRSAFQPPVASRFASSTTEQEPPPRVEPPAGEKPSYTGARHFNLDYDTDSVGPSGVAAVELWGTSDGGRTWTKWGLDADKQSPLRIDVEGDGLYGFRVVVESGIGLAGPRPHAGDTADIWVGVDSVKPRAQLTSAIFGTGEHVGQLDIRWEAADENLKERPITLSFAEQPEGPWTTIAAGLANSGRYLWNADPRLPRQIHLRLEARDEAGNIGSHVLGDPISTEGLSPKGKIRGIRPLDDNTQGSAGIKVVR